MAIYLVDYENVYIEGLDGLESLTKSDEVVIFYTQNRCGLTFELHRRLITCQASVRLMEVTALSTRKNTVKNALDLQLSMYIGYLIGRRPQVPLYIISKDTGGNSGGTERTEDCCQKEHGADVSEEAEKACGRDSGHGGREADSSSVCDSDGCGQPLDAE